jgi:DNA (cytosine-5)-methyltransferase 1
MNSSKKPPVGKVAELFAGVGGFRIGLEKSGLKTVYSNQFEPSTKIQHASSIYVNRFGEDGHSNEDIAEVKKIPTEFDLLVGGFPCQDYSVAKSKNSSHGLRGKKGVLWWEILRIVQAHKPSYIFLENVDRLLKSPANQKGRDFAIMLKTLGDEGYSVEWRVVNAAEYGFPQRRIRVFIVAQKTRKKQKIDLHNLITKSGILAKSLPLEEEPNSCNEFAITGSLESISKNFGKDGSKSPFNNAGAFFQGIVVTTKVNSRFEGKPKLLKDVLVSDSKVPEEFWIPRSQLRSWKELKGAKKVPRKHKASGVEYFYTEGKMAFPDSLDKASRTILTGEGGSSPSRFKHVIKTKNGYRRLMPIELERLNGFPDDWTRYDSSGKEVPNTKRAFLMGNALIVGLIEMVGKQIAIELKKSKKK